MKTTLVVITLGLSLFCKVLNAQSPWVKEKKHAFVQLGGSGIFYDLVRYNNVETDTKNNNYDITTQLYAEYGIAKNVEATFILPYKLLGYKSLVTNTSQSLSGVGNITLGLKYALAKKQIKVSAGLLYSTNSITKDDVKGLRTGFEASTWLPYISLGASKGKWYYFGNIGYGYMTNNYSDFIKIGAEVGYNISSKVHLSAVAELRSPITKESFFVSDKISYSRTANYLDRQQYLAAGLKLNYEVVQNKFGINASVIGAFALDNIPSAGSNNFGVYFKF